MAQYRHNSKCIYCQKSVSGKKRSAEHVLPKCLLQKGADALTLNKRVCGTCNSSFHFETFFSNLTRVALMNQQLKCDLDGTAIPPGFFTKNFSTRKVNGKTYLEPYVKSCQIEKAISGRIYYEFAFDSEAEKELMRGMAKVGLNALLVKPPNPSKDFIIKEHEKVDFSGYEEEFSPLKEYITGKITNKGFVREIKDLNDPCLVGIADGGVASGDRISPNEVLKTTHIVDIHRFEDIYFCFVTLFLGLENSGAIYSVSLNKDLSEYSVEHLRGENSTYVRTIHFHYYLSNNSVIKKKRQGFEPNLIIPMKRRKLQLVTDPRLIYAVNDSRN